MLSIGNKKYRNLQEQVGYNTECIKKLDEYLDGIKVEDKLVVIESDSGTFTDEELVTLSGPLAFISNGSRVWMKDSETLVEFVFKAIDIKANVVGNAYFSIGGSKIVVNRETGAYNTSFDTIITTYSKDQIDSIVANIMAIKADKSELTSGLALKANVSGQAFTGAITAPSIIEDMVGYSKDKPDMPDFTTLYMGAVKNGNKLTLVWFISLTATQTGYSGEILPGIRVPKSLDSALVPFSLSGLDNLLDNKTVPLYSAYNQKVDSTMMIQKYTASLYLNIQPRIYVSGLTVNTTYLFRIEETFLLSDNLAY